MAATLLLAAHGTRSRAGTATTYAIADAVRAARPGLPVELSFLDVTAPSLPDALDRLAGIYVVVVPVLLAAGYHVTSDISSVVAGRSRVTVARHLGPDPAVVTAVADRLAEAGATGRGPALLAAIESSREDARAEVAAAAERLATRLGRPVAVLPLRAPLEVPDGAEVAVYLVAEGGFLSLLHGSSAGVVAEPIGTHPAVVELILRRYDTAG